MDQPFNLLDIGESHSAGEGDPGHELWSQSQSLVSKKQLCNSPLSSPHTPLCCVFSFCINAQSQTITQLRVSTSKTSQYWCFCSRISRVPVSLWMWSFREYSKDMSQSDGVSVAFQQRVNTLSPSLCDCQPL